MIRESSIALGELIAVAGGVFKPSPIVAGLNGESIGALTYGDDFRNEIVATTQEGMHTAILEAASDRLAEIIRDAMGNIRQYGVPLAKKVVDGTNLLYSKDRLRGLVNDQFFIRYINIEDPFFASPLYPAEVRDKALTYTSVDLNLLKQLVFEWPEEDAVRSFIDSSHPDMVEILNNQDESLNNAGMYLGQLSELSELFESKNGVFDFSKVKSLRVNLLLKMYVLLTKMYSSDRPVPWLKQGELSVYRSYVNLMWNGMTLYLIHLKRVVDAYRSRGMVIVQEEPVRMVAHPSGEYQDARFLKGKVQVYYTNAMLAKVDEAAVSFPEAVLGYFWANVTGTRMDMAELVTGPAAGAAKAKEYYAHIHERLSAQSRDLFIRHGLKAIADFINEHPNLSARVSEIRQKNNEMMPNWLRNNFFNALEKAHYLIADKLGSGDVVSAEGDDGRLDVILSTPLVPTFLRACGVNTAADIIEHTFIETGCDDNVKDKRQRLHVSLIELIVSHSLDKA
jgi:hypothetical protein